MNTKNPYTIKLNTLIEYIKKTYDGMGVSFKTVPVTVEGCTITDIHEKQLLLKEHILGSITVAQITEKDKVVLGLSFKSPSEWQIVYCDAGLSTKDKGRFYALSRALSYYEKGLKRLERFATIVPLEQYVADKKATIYLAINKAVEYGPSYKQIRWMKGVTPDRIFV